MKTMFGGAFTDSASSLPAPEASAAAPSAAPRSIDRREISDGLTMKVLRLESLFGPGSLQVYRSEIDCGATEIFALKVAALRKKGLYLQALEQRARLPRSPLNIRGRDR